jgi:hypothetical protein
VNQIEICQGYQMWMKAIALAAALGTAAVDLACAQGVDQNPADRGYPAYAQPDFYGYYMGVPQGHPAGADRPAAMRPATSASRRGGAPHRQGK